MGSLARQIARNARKTTKLRRILDTGVPEMSLEKLKSLKYGYVSPHKEFMLALTDLKTTAELINSQPDIALRGGVYRKLANAETWSVKYHDWEVGYHVKNSLTGWTQRVLIRGPWQDMKDSAGKLTQGQREANEYMESVYQVFFQPNEGDIAFCGVTPTGFAVFEQDYIPKWALGVLQ